MKMGKDTLTFDYTEIEKNKCYCHKTPIFIKEVDLREYQYLTRFLLVKKSYKYFIGYLYNDNKVKPFI